MTDGELLREAMAAHGGAWRDDAAIDWEAAAARFLSAVGTARRSRRLEAISPDLLVRAAEILGGEEQVLTWFSQRDAALGTAPDSLTTTPEGRAAVERLLGQIERGVCS